MIDKPLYVFNFKNIHSDTPAIERSQSRDAVPVVQVFVDNDIVLELGLNIPHSKGVCFFPVLAGSTADILSDRQIDVVISSLPEIFLNDPAISQANFSTSNEYKLQVQDRTIVELLDAESEIMKRQSVLRRARKGGYDTEDRRDFDECITTEIISRDPNTFFYILDAIQRDSDFYTEEARRDFTENVKRIAESEQFKYKRRIEQKEILKEMECIESRLKESGVRTHDIKKSIERTKRNLIVAYKPIDVKEIERLYKNFVDDGCDVVNEDPRFSNYFSYIERMPTSLNGRSNPDYSPEIVTFKVGERRNDSYKRKIIIVKANNTWEKTS